MSSDTPLPPGWTKEFSKSQQKHYYYHHKTNARQWHPPTLTEAQNPELAAERARRKTIEESNQQTDSTATPSASTTSAAGKRKRDDANPTSTTSSTSISKQSKPSPLTSVAIIVPFRDLHLEQKRSSHLSQFSPYISNFLAGSSEIKNYHVYVVEQNEDGRKFNRGKLLNIGYKIAKESSLGHNTFIFHDVDLLPAQNLLKYYSKLPTQPIHIARCWDRYSNNPKYFGGIVSFSRESMEKINGYPNNFWGWGGEDDEMNKRCETTKIKWVGVEEKGGIRDLEEMDIQEKMTFLRGHKEWKCHMKNEVLAEHSSTWSTNGLSSLAYTEISRCYVDEEKCGRNVTKVTVDVGLNGDHWTNEKSDVENLDYTEPEKVRASKK